ncbi:hypothetical protein KY290_034002 [Solanum tuberosum]|uniref:Uncharacterized protein n=1 Tax=Solanum tuberosum TaxID=4113 RepID=A0ABQ7U3W2_SOLTU|nr:hypothetical protein KY289_033382 [Solanum tuberosum]KAH0648018.1 hypothetical protein KY285_033266 [Solanum tuberosum]KAH0740959.1 hypothetical protein KY290_034002 [Solanum tuberosum]
MNSQLSACTAGISCCITLGRIVSRDILAPGYSLWVKFLYCLNFCGMDMILKRMHDCTWIGK